MATQLTHRIITYRQKGDREIARGILNMNHLSNILGVETYKASTDLVKGILEQTWRESFTTRDMRIVTVTLLSIFLIICMQVFALYWQRHHKVRWGMVLFALIFDVFAFAVLIVGQYRFYYWMLDVKAPRSVVIERINPSLVAINWKTYDPELSLVLWGYERGQLDKIENGIKGGELTRVHEVLLSTEVGREVFLEIIVDSEHYGVNTSRMGEPYGVRGLR